MEAYLIFVIFFTQSKFLENKIYTEKRVNYDKLQYNTRQITTNYDELQDNTLCTVALHTLCGIT